MRIEIIILWLDEFRLSVRVEVNLLENMSHVDSNNDDDEYYDIIVSGDVHDDDGYDTVIPKNVVQTNINTLITLLHISLFQVFKLSRLLFDLLVHKIVDLAD